MLRSFSHSCCAFVFHQDVDRSVEMWGFSAEERAARGAVPASHGDTLLGVCHCTSTSGLLLLELSVKALNSCSLLASDQALLFSLA